MIELIKLTRSSKNLMWGVNFKSLKLCKLNFLKLFVLCYCYTIVYDKQKNITVLTYKDELNNIFIDD